MTSTLTRMERVRVGENVMPDEGSKYIYSLREYSKEADLEFVDGTIFIEIDYLLEELGYSSLELDKGETRKLYEAMRKYYND